MKACGEEGVGDTEGEGGSGRSVGPQEKRRLFLPNKLAPYDILRGLDVRMSQRLGRQYIHRVISTHDPDPNWVVLRPIPLLSRAPVPPFLDPDD